MTELKSITTLYIDNEDRLCVADMRDGIAPVTIWLTLRLMQRLLPPLLRWLEQQIGKEMPGSDLLHSLVQQTAKAQTPPQAPVAVGSGNISWLATHIELAFADRIVRLTFNGAAGQTARLTLTPMLLSQWLVIVYKAYRVAEWPLTAWPFWMAESTLTKKPPTAVMH